MIKHSKKETGDIGEKYAVKYLKRNGYKIIEQNYSKPYGEIDIIARDGKNLIFLEVKTRRQDTMTQPYEAVTRSKQQRIIKTAYAYLRDKKIECFCRFDVCEVFVDPDTLKLIRVNYIENAFEAGDYHACY